MPNVEVTPKFEFTWAWFVALLERIFKDVFGFIADSEGWTEEVTE